MRSLFFSSFVLLVLLCGCTRTEGTSSGGAAEVPVKDDAPPATDRVAGPVPEKDTGLTPEQGRASESEAQLRVTGTYSWEVTVTPENTVAARVQVPDGFTRVALSDESFGAWLRTLPVKEGRPEVLLYNGRKKGNQSAHELVLDIDTGDRDLQQCADAVMRLRAEYLYSEERYSDIHFNFTTGDRASYVKWSQGYRPQISNNVVSWSQTARADDSYSAFRAYLSSVFTYAGTASLTRELRSQKPETLKAGDVFIIGGFPGHAVLVVDVAENKTSGEKVFLLAQSYMPAQDMHVLKNPNDPGLSPWYSINFGEELVTPEWTFKVEQLKQFVEAAVPAPAPTATPPEALSCLTEHYGGQAIQKAGSWYLETPGGHKILYDDGTQKSEQQLLDAPDLEDTLQVPYVTGAIKPGTIPTTDPGRARNLELFRSVYGRDAEEVRRALVDVEFAGHRISVHRKVAGALSRVAKRMEPLLRDSGEQDSAVQGSGDARPYVESLGGTFKWRVISGTNRLSAHAFGIAVDLDPKKSAYYQWGTWDGRYHQGIVDAFEAEGFIWGGRWRNYDTMHFEYRPELFDPHCRVQE